MIDEQALKGDTTSIGPPSARVKGGRQKGVIYLTNFVEKGYPLPRDRAALARIGCGS